jgi:hypothetical protein
MPPQSDRLGSVTIGIASRNTRRATELAIRTIRQTTSPQVSLWVGDCASTDGSIAMLEHLRARGLVNRVDVAEGRSHGGWIDYWRETVPSPLLLIADSDVELLTSGWLEQMVDHLHSTSVGLVSVGRHEAGSHTEPNTFTMRTAARPEMYLALLDRERCRSVPVSFDFAMEEGADGSWLAWDTGARFAAELDAHRVGWTTMPPEFGEAVRHWGALSYMTDNERLPAGHLGRLRVRARRLSLEARVLVRLLRARRARPRTRDASRATEPGPRRKRSP